MATNLVDLVKGYLTPDIVQKAAGFVGESESATQKAMSAIVPTLIAATANQATSNGGAEKLTRILDTGNYNGSALSNLPGMFSGGETTQRAITQGKDTLSSLFGNKTEGLVDQIARFAGLKTGSASSLLALVMPLMLSLLGRQRSTIGKSPSALAGLLGEQKGFVSGLLPAGIGSLLGWTGQETARAGTTAYVEPKRESPSWLMPLIVLGGIAVALLGWLLSRPNAVHETTMAVQSAAKKMTDLQLPGGVKVSVPEGSFNYSLSQWLAGTTDTAVPKRFVFDNLNFETASTQLTPDSVPTVDSLVAILKAYPSVVVSLEGHTDNTGDADANKKLSFDRAVAVKELMVKDGIAAERITSGKYRRERRQYRLRFAQQRAGTSPQQNGGDLTDVNVLVQAAADVGLDAGDVRKRLATDEDVALISGQAQEASEKGISGVPTFVFAQKYAVSGAQPAEQLARAIRQVSGEINAQAAE
jgi:predicted DsbA family dithiol-disulfide isomerase